MNKINMYTIGFIVALLLFVAGYFGNNGEIIHTGLGVLLCVSVQFITTLIKNEIRNEEGL